LQHVIQGIIIHSIRYSDQRFIVRIFCFLHGMKTFMIPIGKKGKSSNINLIQPLTLVEFEADIRENIQIHQLKNLRISKPLHHIHFDPVKSAIIMFLDELLYKTIPDDYVNDTLFKYLHNAIVLLDDAFDARNFHLWCLLEISRQYGFYPQFESENAHHFFDLSSSTYVCDRPTHPHYLEEIESAILLLMLDKEWPQVQTIAMSGIMRKNLLDALVKYIRLHLENLREIHSVEILHEVFHG
jgi:DNA repair protein RecO (recombination protein O)